MKSFEGNLLVIITNESRIFGGRGEFMARSFLMFVVCLLGFNVGAQPNDEPRPKSAKTQLPYDFERFLCQNGRSLDAVVDFKLRKVGLIDPMQRRTIKFATGIDNVQVDVKTGAIRFQEVLQTTPDKICKPMLLRNGTVGGDGQAGEVFVLVDLSSEFAKNYLSMYCRPLNDNVVFTWPN